MDTGAIIMMVIVLTFLVGGFTASIIRLQKVSKEQGERLAKEQEEE